MDIMTKVRVLWEKVTGLETKEATTAATLAGILPRIPADYSETETKTGQKWIDGKDIYCISGSTEIGIIETSAVNITLMTLDRGIMVLDIAFEILTENANSYKLPLTAYYVNSNGNVILNNINQSYSNGTIIYTIYYTKPSATREDPEPETRKRKTKKEEK